MSQGSTARQTPGLCAPRASWADARYSSHTISVIFLSALAEPQLIISLCVQLLPFTASCPVSYPYQSLTRVVLGEDHLFAALWEGHGGSQAARHCVSKCYETLLECLKRVADPFAALMQTSKELDRSYFASGIPDLVSSVSKHCNHLVVRTGMVATTLHT